MRRFNLALLAYLQLVGARSPGFNIHEDLLTFPQFEVVFDSQYISEKDAHSLLDSQHPTYSADFAQSTVDQAREADERDNGDNQDQNSPSFTYELMKLPPNEYLCSIPIIQPPEAENKTANELAKAEEARELSRATASGWELLSELEDSCLYFMSGWWSYSFCNNREIIQFHALPSIPNGQPPKRDPHTPDYILGRVPAIPASAAQKTKTTGQDAPPPAELQVKGDQRYLVQKLEGGTICDLTGRERTIEVQYHCVPGMKADRIGWIKEVTICAYLMVVNTPRLCNDVAFLPPEETRANPIQCKLIVSDLNQPPSLGESVPVKEEEAQVPLKQEDTEAKSEDASPGEAAKEPVNIGGVVVGARNVLSGADEAGKPPAKLPPPRSYFSSSNTDSERLLQVVASGKSKEDGGGVTTLSNKELEGLDLKPDTVKDMADRMQKLAGINGWKLELVELPGGEKELRGYIDADEDEVKKNKEKLKKEKEAAKAEKKDGDEDKTEGSEEQFFEKKDEL
ncbi:Protein OS-9 [Fusarium irregulare]|uniref:Endoplasmic reticulum lectin n=1 Tax=Fusarium irregulare TaxID=2494466 RepID=A0A9W8PLX1_9HYPO|nr:Protein OS-9 [Fusarium irregulare]KAJ4014511.1 Protein OS-9 [Fusarium irregulare]